MFEPDFVTSDTHDIVISACQAMMEDESGLCGYYMRIENNSDDKIQLLSKNFNITDDQGNRYFDFGFGFKGELPELNPGEYFEFENVAPAFAGSAVLYGSCRIVKEKNNQVEDIALPALELFSNQVNRFILN